jgi:predicted RNase H-like nuclease (RuvC/YqgF family)
MIKSKTNAIEKFAKKKTKLTLEKVDETIRNLSIKGEKINFNRISNESGVSKSFLYKNKETRKRIEKLRKQQIDQNKKQSKTDATKDLLIESKDKKIRELRKENNELKKELEILRNNVYKIE